MGSQAGDEAFGFRPTPPKEKIDWTPVEHSCGCVVDWGWRSRTIPPPLFIAWFNQLVGVDCPWHGGESGVPVDAPEDAQVEIPDGHGFSFPARKATGESVALGRELTSQLRTIFAAVVGNSPEQLKEQIPPLYRAQMEKQGQDPVNAWLDHQLTNIVLNRGGGVSVEAMEDLLQQKADA